MTALSSEQRSRLVGARLSALVAEHTGTTAPPAVPLPAGAALMLGDTAWVAVDDRPGRGLGTALAWAGRHDATNVAVVADHHGDVLARQALAFMVPTTVWTADGRALAPVDPASPPVVVAASPDELALAQSLAHPGVDVVVEHGVVSLEVQGLEVARVATVDGRVVVQPGVGRNDRDGHATLLAAMAPAPDGDGADPDVVADTVARVAAEVRKHRQGAGADRHPLGRMARQRWLRRFVVGNPGIVGLDALEPIESPVARASVADGDAAVAWGRAADGVAVVVACTSGVDMDFVPAAADAWLIRRANEGGDDARLVLVGGRRDLEPVARRLASRLVEVPTVVELDDDWYLVAPA